MKLYLKKFDVSAGRPVIFLHIKTTLENNISVGDRVEISFHDKKIIGVVDIVEDFLKKNEIALSEDIELYLKAKEGDLISISLIPLPASASLIAKKRDNKELSKEEIFSIIKGIVDNRLNEVELAQFVVAVYRNGMTAKETIYLTEAIFKTGAVLNWNHKLVADKHSIGGIAGNRTTPIVVSICASAGIIMPKTSSRAITSASGTADVMETITKVDFPAETLKKIVQKTGACLAWGGSLGLAPADDKLIRVERILNIDPEAQLLASILSKKLAVGSTHVLIDIPYGKYAKVSKEKGEHLKRKFISIGKHFKLKVEVVLTDGSQPIGNGIGPVLEMIDVLRVLKRDSPPIDLETKSVFLSGKILEMAGKAKKGLGEKMALEILNSKLALKKFEEIISAQGKKNEKLIPADKSLNIRSSHSGTIKEIDNKSINHIASVLGCTTDKRAGIYLHHHNKEKISRGDILMTLYAQSSEKLKEASKLVKYRNPFLVK